MGSFPEMYNDPYRLGFISSAIHAHFFSTLTEISIGKCNLLFQVKDLFNAFQNAGRLYGLNVSEPDTTQPLPPASFQRFLRSDKKIPGVVLTDHEEHYSNK